MLPFVLRTNGIAIPTYLLLNSIAFSVGILWLYRRAKNYEFNLAQTLDLALAALIGSFIGARLFHIVFEYPGYYWARPLEVFKFWQGGFVFYGGFAGALLGILLIARRRGEALLPYLDLAAPILAFGMIIGRIGCFAAGCCYGSPCNLSWAVTFPEGVEAPAAVPVHPAQLYSSSWSLVMLILLLLIERKKGFKRMQPGHLFGLWLVLYSVGRAFTEQFRGDFRGAKPLNLSISTWISFLTLFWGLYLLYRKRRASPHASTSS